MTSRVITNEAEREGIIRFLRSRDLPLTVEVVKGKRRSVDQNRMQRRLLLEIADQTGQTPEEVRAYAKLHIGVAILKAESELFAEKYDAVFKGLPYETKLALMAEPFDFPITRLMSTKAKTDYLDALMQHFEAQGVVFSADERRAA